MAASTEPKLKIPGESTTNPSFAAPQIQTAPDVRQSQAVAGNIPSPVNTSSTGTSQTSQPSPAPTNTAPSSTPKASSTVSSLIPRTSAQTSVSSPAATVPTSTGAPPGVPQTTPPPTVGLAPTPKALQGKNAAENDWIQAQNENAQKLYEAALAYNGGPTSALSENQRRAEAGLRSATANRGAAGTIESSLFGEDKGRIATQQAVGNENAYVKYQTAVTEANEFLNKAQIAYARATEQEKREIAEAAERREQTEAIVNASKSAAAPAPSYPIPPAQQAAIAAGTPAGAGGVVPYEGGGVRVGMPPKPQRKGY